MKIYAYKVKPEDDSTKPLEEAFEFVPVQGAGWLSANFVAAEPLTAA
jgi:hypothetical protein